MIEIFLKCYMTKLNHDLSNIVCQIVILMPTKFLFIWSSSEAPIYNNSAPCSQNQLLDDDVGLSSGESPNGPEESREPKGLLVGLYFKLKLDSLISKPDSNEKEGEGNSKSNRWKPVVDRVPPPLIREFVISIGFYIGCILYVHPTLL